ncbi:hypothetical protein MIR68_009900 [Amoeboaphelidium protococcarum]|nr:hypothetical protein MIR68_009900 [Amoeboaphelidium protococcarum]
MDKSINSQSNSAAQSPMRVTGRQRSSSMSTSAQNQGDRMASNSATPTSAKTTDGNYRRMTLFEPTVADDQSFLGKNTSMDALAQAFGGSIGSSNSYANNKRSSRAFDEKKISSISAVVQGPMVKTGDQYGSRNISPLPQKISTDYERDFTLQAKSYHYYSSDETAMCCQWINENLMPHLDPDLSHLFTDTFSELPTHPPECDEALFKACQDGWLLAKVINFVVPNSIDFKAMKRNPKSKAHVTENIQVMLRGAKQIGVKMNNIGSEDVYKGVPHLILALTWQIIKLGLLSKVDVTANPLLNQLLTENERQGDVTKINNETLLLKWVNFHLNAASCDLKISNFNGDLKDGQVLMNLLRQLSHGHENEQFIAELYQTNINATSVRERAESALQMADEMGVRSLITVDDIINGNKDHAIAFIAQLLNKFPNLEESMQSKVAFVQKQSVDNLLGSVNNISKQQPVQATPSADDQLLQLQKEVAALRQELDAERDKNATLSIDYAQLDGAYQMLDRQHSSTVTELQLVKDQLIQSNQEVMQNNQTLDKVRADYQQVTAQLQSLKLQSSSEQSHTLKLRNEVEMLQNVVSREQNDRQQLEQTLELQRQERAKDSDLIRKLQIQISGISSSSGGEKLLLERIKLSLINFKSVESYEDLPDVTSLACSQLSNTMIELTALKESFAKVLNEKQKLAEQDIPNLTRNLKQSEDRVSQIQDQRDVEVKEMQKLVQKAEQDCMSKAQQLSLLQGEVQRTSKELAKAEERLQDILEQSRQSGPEMEQRMTELKRQLQEKTVEAEKWQQTCRAISKDQVESSQQSVYKYQQYNLNGKIQEILCRVKRLNDEVVQCK